MFIEPMLFSDFYSGSIFVDPARDTVGQVASGFQEYQGVGLVLNMVTHSFITLPFWLAVAGIFAAWLLYIRFPEWPAQIRQRVEILWYILDRKYGFDEFNEAVFAKGSRNMGSMLWRVIDDGVIDGFLVNGLAQTVRRAATRLRAIQSGYVYHYAFTMIIGLFLLITWFAAS